MHRLFALLTLLTLLMSAHAQALDSGDQMPAFALPGRDGGVINSDSLRGNIIIVDFWASWCPPCRVSLPRLNDVANDYADRGVKVVLVSVDHAPQSARDLLEELGLSGASKVIALFDSNELAAGLFHPTTMPTTFIFDRSGHVVFMHRGFKAGDEKLIRQEIESQLGSSEATKA